MSPTESPPAARPVLAAATAFADLLNAEVEALHAREDGDRTARAAADTWPGVGGPAAGEPATAVRQGIRGALFPSAIVILLIWLAVETFR